jgi:hypothetical protein
LRPRLAKVLRLPTSATREKTPYASVPKILTNNGIVIKTRSVATRNWIEPDIELLVSSALTVEPLCGCFSYSRGFLKNVLLKVSGNPYK